MSWAGIMSIAFGPVPSRRLGRSLGVNNIPPKSCSYSCLYCQVGETHGQTIALQSFYSPEQIYAAVEEQVAKAHHRNEPIDYLSFVPDGEPTLDIHLGRTIERLRSLHVRIAVITNASLLWREEVRAALGLADWVSVKVDTTNEGLWRQLNRPHAALDLATILAGIREFASHFQGELTSETMLLKGINDGEYNVAGVAAFLRRIGVDRAYLAIPTRPTAEAGVCGPDERALNRAYQILSNQLPQVETLIGYEGDDFAFSGDVRSDLLGITAVHPMRESAIRQLLARAGADEALLAALVAEGELKAVDYLGERYYVRRLAAVGRDARDEG